MSSDGPQKEAYQRTLKGAHLEILEVQILKAVNQVVLRVSISEISAPWLSFS